MPRFGLAVLLLVYGTLTAAARTHQEDQTPGQMLSHHAGEYVIEAYDHIANGEYEAALDVIGSMDRSRSLTSYETSILLRLEAHALYHIGELDLAAHRFVEALETGALYKEERLGVLASALRAWTEMENYTSAVRAADLLKAEGASPPPEVGFMMAEVYRQVGNAEAAIQVGEAALAAATVANDAQLRTMECIYVALGRIEARDEMRQRREQTSQPTSADPC